MLQSSYNIDGINNMGRSDVTKLAEEIVTDRVSEMDKLFYPTKLRGGEEVPVSVEESKVGFNPFAVTSVYSRASYLKNLPDKNPTLFPTDDVASTADFRQNRGGN